jgi:mono/diheme cytochrome c family protein
VQYPFWDQPLGHGLLMALVAVFHVFIAHFAIGGGLYLVVTEFFARRRKDQEALAFLEELSRFFVLTTLVVGALSGVGIWFVIGLLSPAGTEVLIHLFVWAWATEWTFFVLEIAAAIFYFYGWRHMAQRAHLTLGWIYFVSAWMSLAVINGIITFMLTPGKWLQTGQFWDAFFNPTYWPSLVLRTGIALCLAGLYVLLVLSRREASDFKVQQVRMASLWGLGGLALAAPALHAYWVALPEAARVVLMEQMTGPMHAWKACVGSAGVLAFFLVVFGLALPRRFSLPVGLLVMVLGFTSFGCFEWFRESGRKPFVITGYLYANGVPVSQVKSLRKTGLLPRIVFRTGNDGADLFRTACRSCHTLHRLRPLAPVAEGMDVEFLTHLIQETRTIRGNMPPFSGTAKEARLIAEHLAKQSDRRPLETITGLTGKALGKVVWRHRCGACHKIGGFRDVGPSFEEMTAEEISETLGELEMYSEEMPSFTGSEVERAALVDYLLTLKSAKEGEKSDTSKS